MGIALLVISAYPLVLKPDFVKKEHGIILVFVALIFLARGFVDLGNRFTDIYDDVFIMFDLPIAIIAFILLVFVILRILVFANRSNDESKTIRHDSNRSFDQEINRVHHSKKHSDFDYVDKKTIRVKNNKKSTYDARKQPKVNFKNHVDKRPVVEDELNSQSSGINESSENIHFESNDILDDYK